MCANVLSETRHCSKRCCAASMRRTECERWNGAGDWQCLAIGISMPSRTAYMAASPILDNKVPAQRMRSADDFSPVADAAVRFS